jgi:hypothetical protein
MRLVTLALALGLSGCVAPPPGTAPPTPSTPALSGNAPFAFNFTSPSCQETDLLFFVDTPTAQKLLPPGFHAADATGLVGSLPAASGKSVYVVADIVCASSTIGPIGESAFGVFVDPPKVNGSRAAATFDFYEPYRYVDGANESAPFAAMGWDAGPGRVTSTATPTGGASTLQANSTTLLTATLTIPPPGAAFSGIGRFWHATALGLGYMDYKAASNQRLGGADCTLADGSPYAKLAGTTTCAPGSTAGMMFDPYKLDASIVNLPGATAS